MNIIKAIEDLNTKIDYLILKGENQMLDANTLHTELSRAANLVSKSKSFISYLLTRAHSAEANLVSHVEMLANSAVVESVVSDAAAGFKKVFDDFEGFLNISSNTSSVAANVVSNTANVAANTTESLPVRVEQAVANVVTEVVHDVEEVPTIIRTDTQEIFQGARTSTHNVDPRLLHTTPVANT